MDSSIADRKTEEVKDRYLIKYRRRRRKQKIEAEDTKVHNEGVRIVDNDEGDPNDNYCSRRPKIKKIDIEMMSPNLHTNNSKVTLFITQ